MNEIKIWAVGVCAAAISGTVLENLVPSGSLKKLYSLLFSVFLLWMIADPLISLLKNPAPQNFSFQSGMSEESIEAYAEEYTMDMVRKNVEELAAKEIYESGLSYKNILVDTDIDEEGSIHINKITVTCEKEDGEEIVEILERVLQIPTEVITDEG